MKYIIKKALRFFGYKVINIESDHIFNFEVFLYRHLSRHGKLFFVQIGANNGVTADPIHDFVKKYPNKVSGIAVEPLPDVFESLRHNYRNCPNITTLNVAIHNTEKTMKLYRVDPKQLHKFKGVSRAVAPCIASFDKDFYLRAPGITSDSIIEEKVSCISIEKLLAQHGITKIDLLLIDTEGYDTEIILNLDFKKVKPRMIRFEHGLKDGIMTSEMFLRVTQYLNVSGYQLIAENYDVTGYLLDPADFK